MRTDAVIMIAGAHDARNAASRLMMPVPDGSCQAGSWPGGGGDASSRPRILRRSVPVGC
jgi:hypothetical protein